MVCTDLVGIVSYSVELAYIIYSCTGSQFGLPDPYGSSCISGYYGRDCNTGKNLALSIVVQGVSLVYQIPMDPAASSGYSGRDCNTGKNLALSIVVQGVSLVY